MKMTQRDYEKLIAHYEFLRIRLNRVIKDSRGIEESLIEIYEIERDEKGEDESFNNLITIECRFSDKEDINEAKEYQ